ncbi:MAG: hypothetical protein PHZ02_00975 [Desulfocapsaceae bacterium]|nr:hypothetical protein [Desulfocapsaceae bacterium]
MFILFVMAGKTEIHGRLIKLLRKRGSVWVMTSQAAPVCCKAAVFYRNLGDFILLVGMTGKAEGLGAFCRQIEFKVAAVGAMALDTTICNGAMNKLLAGKFLLLVGVAGIADIVTFSHQ